MQEVEDGNRQAASGGGAAIPSTGPSQTCCAGSARWRSSREADKPIGMAELAARLGLHRSIAYRIVRTLEEHRAGGPDGCGRPGPGHAARRARPRRRARPAGLVALPELTAVANGLGMTAFVAVFDADEVIALVSVEPRHAAAPVAQRPVLATRCTAARRAPRSRRPSQRRSGLPWATGACTTRRSSTPSPATPPVTTR